jgi:hypothetical protein
MTDNAPTATWAARLLVRGAVDGVAAAAGLGPAGDGDELPLSARAAAALEGCSPEAVRTRRNLPPGARVRSLDRSGSWPARRLTPAERDLRDREIVRLIGAGVHQAAVAERLSASKGVVSRVAASVPGRRRRGEYRRWKAPQA